MHHPETTILALLEGQRLAISVWPILVRYVEAARKCRYGRPHCPESGQRRHTILCTDWPLRTKYLASTQSTILRPLPSCGSVPNGPTVLSDHLINGIDYTPVSPTQNCLNDIPAATNYRGKGQCTNILYTVQSNQISLSLPFYSSFFTPHSQPDRCLAFIVPDVGDIEDQGGNLPSL